MERGHYYDIEDFFNILRDVTITTTSPVPIITPKRIGIGKPGTAPGAFWVIVTIEVVPLMIVVKEAFDSTPR